MKRIIRRISFKRSIKPAREGIGFILLTLAIGVAAINTGNNLLYLILAMMLSMIIISGILSEVSLSGIEAERRLPQNIFASTPFTLRVRITNRKWFLSSFLIILKEITMTSGSAEANIFKIPPRHTSYTNYMACFEKRGRQRLEGFILSTSFPFGFFVKSLKKISTCEVIVYPRIDILNESIRKDISLIGHTQEGKKRGRGASLYNVRDYIAGEDSRSIHWKSTARQSRLMIKEFEREEERMVNLFLVNNMPDLGSISKEEIDHFEMGIEITASLANFFLKKDFSVGLFTFDKGIPPAYGMKHLYRILEELALLDIKDEGEDYLVKRSASNLHMGLIKYNATNILILPWDYQGLNKAGSLFSKILRIGVDA